MSALRERVKHCGSDRSAIRDVKYNGISTYCFRCGETEWEHREPVLRPPAGEVHRGQDVQPDVGDAWPAHATAWLAAIGFGRYERQRVLGAYWNQHSERIIFPLHAGFWTARAVPSRAGAADGRIKWLSSLHGRDRCVQEYRGEGASSVGLPVVLTEDILSAAKIGMSGAPVVAIPCLGTLPSAAVLARAGRAPAVIWWLDPDGAGQSMARRGHRRMGAIGRHSSIIETYDGDRDPKYLSADEIRRRLSSHT